VHGGYLLKAYRRAQLSSKLHLCFQWVLVLVRACLPVLQLKSLSEFSARLLSAVKQEPSQQAQPVHCLACPGVNGGKFALLQLLLLDTSTVYLIACPLLSPCALPPPTHPPTHPVTHPPTHPSPALCTPPCRLRFVLSCGGGMQQHSTAYRAAWQYSTHNSNHHHHHQHP